MAEKQDDRQSEDLLDEPSQTKIDELREKGQVSQSRELTGLFAIMACAAALYAFSPAIARDMFEYMREIFRVDETARLNLTSNAVLGDTLMKALKLMAFIGLPISIAGFISGVLGSFIQVGSIFSLDPLQPSMSKINPISGMARLFSMKHLMDSARVILKVTIASFVAYGLVKTEVFTSPTRLLQDPSMMLHAFSEAGKTAFLTMVSIFAVFAGFDWWMQRYDWMKQVRLTKQEAKEEAKQREGNPQIKARIRSVQREMSRKRMMAAVKKADVIVTNPTHIAIAITYDKDKMMAPRVVAKGADFIAQKIKQIAAEAGVPLVENVPLARTLYKSVKVNQYIPRALYQAVAEVLAYVYRLKNSRDE